MTFVLALDQGTSSSRAIVFDEQGQMRSQAQREFDQHFPRPGWVEHEPEDLWATQIASAVEAIQRANLKPSEIASIGITNQRETALLWDRQTGQAVAPAIVWQDRRTAPACRQLIEDGHGDLIREKTGLVVDAYFSATKLAWLLNESPDAASLRTRAARGELAFGTVDSWLIHRLTGGTVHVTDVSNASRTMLFDLHRLQWDQELLALFDIPAAVLPEVVPSSGTVGKTAPDVFNASIPIAGIAGDQQAALFGQAAFSPGVTKCTYGTGCFLLTNTGAEPVASQQRLLTTIAWKIGDETTYALEGSVFIGGAVVQWLRDGLKIIRSSADVEALAASEPDNGGVCFVPAFTGMGAPYWDSDARGTLVGLTRGSTGGHVARAALESIAFQVADVVEAMSADSPVPISELRVDGGASDNDALMAWQADVCQLPVHRAAIRETTALGAAYLAGLGTGVWSSQSEIASLNAVNQKWIPGAPRETDRAAWRRAVACALAWSRQEA